MKLSKKISFSRILKGVKRIPKYSQVSWENFQLLHFQKKIFVENLKKNREWFLKILRNSLENFKEKLFNLTILQNFKKKLKN